MNQTRYEFVRGPLQEVRDAWLRYARELPQADTAHFIPATGGCFVVLMSGASPSSRWYEAMSLTRRVAPNLRRFRDEFEKANRDARSRVVAGKITSRDPR